MKIAYYMPFKPMGHANPSGDLVTGTELFNHLKGRGHAINLASRLRCRWIYYRPLAMLRLLGEKRRIVENNRNHQPDLWLSYHSYYKAPDLLGPLCSHHFKIPYVIFQGIYSTKRRKQLKTLPGFLLNRKSLLSADLVFTNKQRDLKNLQRILPEKRLCYIAPGIHPDHFQFSSSSRTTLRKKWAASNETVILTAAMMRPGVKADGIETVIESCHHLLQEGMNIRLIVVGDGSCRSQLEKRATELLPQRVDFLGKVARNSLVKYYSGADIFAFPGVNESLGMVYLEAQACTLPVVAYQDWGGGEAVLDGHTGLLSPAGIPALFTENLKRLIRIGDLRKTLGIAAAKHVRLRHDLVHNYNELEDKLTRLVINR